VTHDSFDVVFIKEKVAIFIRVVSIPASIFLVGSSLLIDCGESLRRSNLLRHLEGLFFRVITFGTD